MSWTPEMKTLWDKVPAHDWRAHGGKALNQTGIVKGCYRCRFLTVTGERRLAMLQHLAEVEARKRKSGT